MKKLVLVFMGVVLGISISIFAEKADESRLDYGRGDCGTCTDFVPKR